MGWFQSKEQEVKEQPSNPLASRSEITAAFEGERDYLFWIALLITGEANAANESIMNASELATGESVFRVWLIRWARSATA